MAKYSNTIKVNPNQIAAGLSRIEDSLREAKGAGWNLPITVTIEIK